MFLYNWKRIFETCEGNAIEMVRVLKMLVFKQVPKNRYDKIYRYSTIDFRGESFLIHPDVLLCNEHKYGYKDICIYVAIASLRPYADYVGSYRHSIRFEEFKKETFLSLLNGTPA